MAAVKARGLPGHGWVDARVSQGFSILGCSLQAVKGGPEGVLSLGEEDGGVLFILRHSQSDT